VVEIVRHHALGDGKAFRMERIVGRFKALVASGILRGLSVSLFSLEEWAACVDGWDLLDHLIVIPWLA
jgi:hypothetical protein